MLAAISFSCNTEDAAEPTVKIKFTIDNSNSCAHSGENNPDESLATVKVYRNTSDWASGTNAIFDGQPNANGVIDLGNQNDATFYYDLKYKTESNWEPNPFLEEGANMNFTYNRNLASPIQVSTSLVYGDANVLGLYVLDDYWIDSVSAYPDSCKTDLNSIEFRKDFSVTLRQTGEPVADDPGMCDTTVSPRVDELVLSKIKCGFIDNGDIQHNTGAVIQDKYGNETMRVIDGQTVVRDYKNGFKNITLIYKRK